MPKYFGLEFAKMLQSIDFQTYKYIGKLLRINLKNKKNKKSLIIQHNY